MVGGSVGGRVGGSVAGAAVGGAVAALGDGAPVGDCVVVLGGRVVEVVVGGTVGAPTVGWGAVGGVVAGVDEDRPGDALAASAAMPAVRASAPAASQRVSRRT
jgi:hypothetical protein